jgi:SAM-dependent methyltransferase
VRDVEYFTSNQEFAYVLCQDCGAVSLVDPPVHDLARIYPPNYYSFQTGGPGLAQRVKDVLDKRLFRGCLQQLPASSLAVMDVGGGSGYQLSLIRQIEPRVQKTLVVDLDARAKSLAEGQGHLYFHGRIEDYQPQAPFDLILALNLIEHVANPGEVLLKLKDCLSPTGLLLIKTPNLDSLDQRLFRHKNWGGFHCPRHWVLFTKESFLALTAQVGLAAAHFSYTQGAPFWAVSVLAALQRRKWIRLDGAHPAYQHPLYRVFIILFAAFDFVRRPWAKPSQMFVILRRA